MKIKIKGFIPNTLLDWEGMIVSTIYLPYCNFRCPYCQNSSLIFSPEKLETISLEEVKEYLTRNKKWVDGVCITGGEPCIYKELPEFLSNFREMGLKIKLDTNGSFPSLLKKVIQEGLVDYIAMDIKAPLLPSHYQASAGKGTEEILRRVKESIQVIKNSGIDYEFRTTVVPTLHSPEDILEIAKSIKGARRFYLQNFVPQDTLNPEFMKITPYSRKELEKVRERIKGYFEKCEVRGK